MPTRIPLDETAVLTLYAELGSGRETAKRLGVHENSVYAVLKRHRGVCVRCGRTLAPGKKHCAACLQSLRERQRIKNKERRRNGLCAACDEPLHPRSTQFCAKHRLGHLEAAERHLHKQKQSRHVPGNYGAPLPNMREKQLRYNYGDAGVNVWRTHQGRCVLCDIPHAERAVHIHHIDRDETNHTESNLTCLCLRCHHTVHRLVDHPDLPRMLAWLKSNYPGLPW